VVSIDTVSHNVLYSLLDERKFPLFGNIVVCLIWLCTNFFYCSLFCINSSIWMYVQMFHQMLKRLTFCLLGKFMGHFVCELLIVTLIMNISNINAIASQLRLNIFS
jgi:hypothetical protein